MVLALLLSTSLIYLIYQVMVLAGLLKGPILRMFQKYGDAEPFYYPLPGMLLALAAFVLGLSVWVEPIMGGRFLPAGPPLVIVGLAWLAFHFREEARAYPRVFMAYPQWIRQLREYTTRDERRRIAYMWLRLPLRTRLMYNSNDRAFLLWADLLVLSTGE